MFNILQRPLAPSDEGGGGVVAFNPKEKPDSGAVRFYYCIKKTTGNAGGSKKL